jgi:hypothetical protein
MPSDAQVLQDLIDAFELAPELRCSRLYVDVRSRVVTIRGRVQSDAERQAAERVARGVAGLRALVLEVGVVSRPKMQMVAQKDASAHSKSVDPDKLEKLFSSG